MVRTKEMREVKVLKYIAIECKEWAIAIAEVCKEDKAAAYGLFLIIAELIWLFIGLPYVVIHFLYCTEERMLMINDAIEAIKARLDTT